MSTVSVSRSDVTVEEVSAVLRRRLGSRYRVTPAMMASGFGKTRQGDTDVLLVAANWLERANVQVTTHQNSTEIQVSPGATYFGLIRFIDRVGLVRKVHQALQHAPELNGSD